MNDTLLTTPATPAATPGDPAPASTPAAPAPAPGQPAPTPAAPAPAAAPTQATPAAFLGEGLVMNFEGLAPHLQTPEQRSRIDGLKDRFDGKPVTEFLEAYGNLEGDYTRIKQATSLPDAPTLDAYGITKPEGIEDAAWQAEVPKIEGVLKIAHEAGIGKQGFAKLRDWFNEQEAAAAEAQVEAAKTQRADAYNNLVDAWGNEFDAKRETASNFTNGVLQSLQLTPDDPNVKALFNNPAFIRIMHHEATDPKRGPVEGSTTLPAGATSPISPAEEASRIATDPTHPLHEKFIEESKRGGGPTIDHVERLRSKVRIPRQ